VRYEDVHDRLVGLREAQIIVGMDNLVHSLLRFMQAEHGEFHPRVRNDSSRAPRQNRREPPENRIDIFLDQIFETDIFRAERLLDRHNLGCLVG
jgi:hypothetical protein